MIPVLSMTMLAAMIGTLARWGIGGSIWGLLLVNVAGSAVAGYVGGWASLRPLADTPIWVPALLIGLCGALTTFSGFALMGVRLLNEGEFFKFASHFFLNNALCLLVCYGGWKLATRGL